MDPLPPPTPMVNPGGMAHLRAIHASPDGMAREVTVYLDGATTPVIPSLAYRGAVGYNDVTAGTHTVQARLPGSPPTSPPALVWQTPPFQAGHSYTIIAHGLALETPTVTFSPEEDTAATTPSGMALVRFFHALIGASPVDVCVGAVPVFANVAYGNWGTSNDRRYAQAPAGSATLQVRAAAARPCTGRSMGHVTATVDAGNVITLVAVGRVGRRNQAVTAELLACTDAPLAAGASSSCMPLPIAP